MPCIRSNTGATTPMRNDTTICERCGWPFAAHARVTATTFMPAPVFMCPSVTFTQDPEAPMHDARQRERAAIVRANREDGQIRQAEGTALGLRSEQPGYATGLSRAFSGCVQNGTGVS